MEKLFLLEVLVENVEIDYSKVCVDKSILDSAKQLCIKFQFLTFPELVICEEDFCSADGDYQKSVINIKSGKSCLFSIRKWNAEDKSLPLSVTVLRQNPTPPHITIGKACINLGSSFTNILASAHSPENTSTVTKKCTDVYVLTDNDGTDIGKIRIFVRLTCFGPLIVTQFQISGDENNSYLFRGTDGSGVVTFNRNISEELYEKGASGGVPKGDPCDPQGTSGSPYAQGGYTPGVPSGGQGVMTGGHEMYPGGGQGMMPDSGLGMMPGGVQGMMPGAWQGMMPGAGQGMMPGAGQGMMPGGWQGMMPGAGQGMMMSGGQGMMQGGGQGMMPDMYASGDQSNQDYKEFGAEVNGHSLSIKVLRKPKKPKKPSQPFLPICGHIPISKTSSSSSTDEDNQHLTQQPGIQVCDCDIPLPPGFPDGYAPKSNSKKKKRKEKGPKVKCPLQLSGDYCLKPNCPMGYPTFSSKQPGKKVGCKAVDIKEDGAPKNQRVRTPSNTNRPIGILGDVPNTQRRVKTSDEQLHTTGKPTFILNVPPSVFPVEEQPFNTPFQLQAKTEKKEFHENATQYLEKDISAIEKSALIADEMNQKKPLSPKKKKGKESKKKGKKK